MSDDTDDKDDTESTSNNTPAVYNFSEIAKNLREIEEKKKKELPPLPQEEDDASFRYTQGGVVHIKTDSHNFSWTWVQPSESDKDSAVKSIQTAAKILKRPRPSWYS